MSTKPSPENLHRMVAAITHENTGYSPLICDRLRRLSLRLAVGNMTTNAAADFLGVRVNSPLYNTTCAGESLGFLISESASAKGRFGGRRPNVLRLDPGALETFASKARSSLFDGLSQQNQRILKRVDRTKVGIEEQQAWWHVGCICRGSALSGNAE